MTTFDKREEGFEKQFAHDEELRFKATARRNKLLGLWAAEKLGLCVTERCGARRGPPCSARGSLRTSNSMTARRRGAIGGASQGRRLPR